MAEKIICNGKYRYDPRLVLGSGGFGVVYGDREGKIAVKKVDYENVKRSIASIKEMVSGVKSLTLNPEDIDIVIELNNLKSIRHQNIVEMFDFDKQGPKLFIVLERCDGDLDGYIKREGGQLSEGDVKIVTGQVAGALGYLHSLGMAHRDIKPPNILTKGSQFKVSDFGLSKFGADFISVLGTPHYTAPEIADHKPYNVKVDVWSLGVVILECCLGWNALRVSFNGKKLDVVALMTQSSIAQYGWNGLQNLLMIMLQVEPYNRCSMQDVINHKFVRY